MTLVVGCQTTGTTWIDADNKNKIINNAFTASKAYQFNPPTLRSNYCTIGSYSIINVVNDN